MMMTFVQCNHISNLCLICHNGGWEKNNKSEHKILRCHAKKYYTTIGRNIALTSEQILDYDKKHHNNCKCCPLSLFFEGLVTMNVEIDVLIVRNVISVSKVTRVLDRSLIVFFKCLCHCCCLCHCLFVGKVFSYSKQVSQWSQGLLCVCHFNRVSIAARKTYRLTF